MKKVNEMKKIIIVSLVFFTIVVKAQSRIGFTLEEIKKEFYANTITVKTGDDGNKYATMLLDYSIFAYYFDSHGICLYCIQIPNDVNSTNAIVESYNKKYVVVDDNNWKSYVNGGIVYIKLRYQKSFEGYAFWYESKE